MEFKQKYKIEQNFLTKSTKRRSGQLITPSVKFIVAHDTGNPTSTAENNVKYYERTNNEAPASAHIFVDDKKIIECIPSLTTDKPEKAWHVRYNQSKDNELFGYEANDAAIGVEYCYGQGIDANEAYARFIWVISYLCHKFGLNPKTSITGHFILDPGRKTDPVSGLKDSNRTYEKLVEDIGVEYQNCLEDKNKNLNINEVRNNTMMKLIQNTTSKKVYAVGQDNKKHWIFNEKTFNIGRGMNLWGDRSNIEEKNDDGFEEGHTIILISKP